jgi:hypothetical protein
MSGINQEHAEIAAIAPVRCRAGRTFPDLFNNIPSRHVSQQEAIARNWPYFFVGDACGREHRAPRFTNSPRTCVDCLRQKNGKPLLSDPSRAISAPLAGYSVERGRTETSPPPRNVFKWKASTKADFLWNVAACESSLCDKHRREAVSAIAVAADEVGCPVETVLQELERSPQFFADSMRAKALGAECLAAGVGLLMDRDNNPCFVVDTLPATPEQDALTHKIVSLCKALPWAKAAEIANGHAIAHSDGDTHRTAGETLST